MAPRSVHVPSSCNKHIIKSHGWYSHKYVEAMCNSTFIAAYVCALTAGSHDLWQASIRVSHTSACTLGPSQPNKKLRRYVTDNPHVLGAVLSNTWLPVTAAVILGAFVKLVAILLQARRIPLQQWYKLSHMLMALYHLA